MDINSKYLINEHVLYIELQIIDSIFPFECNTGLGEGDWWACSDHGKFFPRFMVAGGIRESVLIVFAFTLDYDEA